MSDNGAFAEREQLTKHRPNHPGRPPRNDVDPVRVKLLRAEGHSFRQIARDLGAGYGTVRRALSAVANVSPELSQNPVAEGV
jgi:DNA invertase Pin-like site-specific DNA recombinase